MRDTVPEQGTQERSDGPPGMTETEAAAWSPLASSHHPARRIIAYGGQETAPFLEQASLFHGRLSSSIGKADLISAPSLNHMSVVLDLADPEGFLGKHLHDLVAAPPPSATRKPANEATTQA